MEEKEKLIKWPDLLVVNYRTTTGLIQVLYDCLKDKRVQRKKVEQIIVNDIPIFSHQAHHCELLYTNDKDKDLKVSRKKKIIIF